MVTARVGDRIAEVGYPTPPKDLKVVVFYMENNRCKKARDWNINLLFKRRSHIFIL